MENRLPPGATPKKCHRCGKWFVPNPAMQNVSCCVLHAPGTCCHYSDTEVPESSRAPGGGGEAIFSCPICGDPFARVVGGDLDIHSGATYECDKCGGEVVFVAMPVEEYVRYASPVAPREEKP